MSCLVDELSCSLLNRSSFAFADENKELNVHFQYNYCPDLTFFVHFSNKKNHANTYLSIFLMKKNRCKVFISSNNMEKTCIHS